MVAFVGRRAELEVLRARLDDALSGRPQIVQIQGPAGIGKTALVEHFLELITPGSAPPDGHPAGGDNAPVIVLRASGEETEELLAYGVLDQLARSLARTVAGDATRAGALAAGVANPQTGVVADRGGNLIDDPVTIGTRLLEFLDHLGGAAIVLAVDDAHWADRPSLQALIFALRRLSADQVLAVLAVREDTVADLPESLSRMINAQRGTVLRLRGLEEDDLRDLAAAMGIDGIGAGAARRLHYGTQGNPLYARALLEEFPPAEWGPDEQLLPPPLSFRRRVQERYSSSAPATRRLLDAAAVLGPNCPLPLAVALGEVTEPIEALDEASRLDLLRVSQAQSPWTLTFSHPLIRAAVYEALGLGRRHALHTAAAGLVSDESTVLRHRVAAAAERDEALANDLTRFAENEASRQSWQSAAAHLVDASRLSPDARKAQRRVLRAMIWTMLRGDAATASGFAAEIAAYPNGPLREVVLGSLAMAADAPVTAEGHLTAAWEACTADEDPQVRGSVALMTGIHWYGRLNAAATVTWCRRALSVTAAGTAEHAVAQTYLVHGLGHSGRTTESIAASAAAGEDPDDAGQLWLTPRSARGLLRLVDDDIDGARADLESVAMTASRLGILNTAAYGFAYLARAEWIAGQWDDALLHAERAVAINLQADFGFMQSAVTGVAMLVPAGRGDWASAESYLRSMTANDSGYERSVVALGIARARVGEARGRPADVVAALEPVRHFAAQDAVDEPGFWPWQDLYADALVSVGRVPEADAFLRPHEELAEQRGRRSAIARLARTRGRVEAAAGRPEDALRAFTRALEAVEHLPMPFERGRIELAAGSFLRRAGQRRRAVDLLTDASGHFAGLGAAPYLERCATELAASGLAPTRRNGRDRAGLTSQELVVARLAAGGRSNREIADELVVSIKTIEYHLRNAFGKLAVTSRRQLPDRLAELAGRPDGAT